MLEFTIIDLKFELALRYNNLLSILINLEFAKNKSLYLFYSL